MPAKKYPQSTSMKTMEMKRRMGRTDMPSRMAKDKHQAAKARMRREK